MTEAQADTRDTPVSHASRPLLILAADHRSSLERDLYYGLTAAPTPEQAAWISADKMLIYQALLDAVPELPASVQPGILIDEQYGAAIAELAVRAGGDISLAMPIEASGRAMVPLCLRRLAGPCQLLRYRLREDPDPR